MLSAVLAPWSLAAGRTGKRKAAGGKAKKQAEERLTAGCGIALAPPQQLSSMPASSIIKTAGVVAAGAVVVSSAFLGLLYVAQDKLIYHPRRYHDYGLNSYYNKRTVDNAVEDLEFTTSDGRQKAFVLRGDGGPQGRVWLFMGGNAGVALDWAHIARAFLRKDPTSAATILVDYPGYGMCQGHPSPDSMVRGETGGGASDCRCSSIRWRWWW